ncbi:MAG: TylF/MycF/NovP-related O-methyltransferase [Crinalium sp.]
MGVTKMFYGISEENVEKFNESLNSIINIYEGNVFAADMLIAIAKNLSFWYDEKFSKSFKATAQTDQEKSLAWRLHVLTWAASHVLHLEGDFVECGVLRGFSSAVICKYLDFENIPKNFYLYDTFSGLPEETSTEEERAGHSVYKTNYNSEELFAYVQNIFSIYPNVRIVKGIVPYSFTEAVPEKISYFHIDMNSAQAEILALEHLFDKVVPGGMIILDDFGWSGYRGQTLAEIKFMQDRGYKILELPTGQGLVLKR